MKLLSLPNRGYVCRWRDAIDGRERQQSMTALGITNRDQAVAWAVRRSEALLAQRADIAAGGITAVRVPCEQAMDRFLERTSKATSKGRKQVLNHLVAHLERAGIRDMASISAPVLTRWRNDLTGPTSKYAESTQNRWIGVALAWVRWAGEEGACPGLTLDAMSRALRPVKVKRDAIQFLPPTDLQQLLKSALTHDKANPHLRPVAPLLLLAITTGMRRGELFGLRWANWDQDGECIRLGADATKTRQARAITLTVSPIATDLLRAMQLRATGPHVFEDLPMWEWDNRSSVRLKAKYGAPEGTTLHALRRTTGTVLACMPAAPLSVWSIAQRMGHGVALAEKCYVGALSGLPKGAQSIEAATGITKLGRQIIARVGGIVGGQEAEAG